MAYPSVTSPYGLIPINLIGGQVFAGSTRQLPIATNSSTAIFYGDVVKLLTGGTIGKDTGTDSATPVGVFLGILFKQFRVFIVRFFFYLPVGFGIVVLFYFRLFTHFWV